MQYRNMGRTGLQLSVLSFGSWVSFHKQIDDGIADELMGIAYDNGVNFFDNAEVYALGESEKMMGRVLKKKNWDRTSYTVSSKVFWGWRGKENKPNQHGLSRKHITEACHEALQRLQTDYLDLYFCHRPDKNVPIEEVVWTMHNLIMQGKILYWGTSEWSGVEIMEAHRIAQQHHLIGPTVEQPQYNLFERNKIENEFLMVYKTVGLGTTIWSQDKVLNAVQSLGQLASELGVTLPALSIAWCVKNPNVTTAILGATRKEQLIENLKSLDVLDLLTPEVMNRIDTITGTKPILPEY